MSQCSSVFVCVCVCNAYLESNYSLTNAITLVVGLVDKIFPVCFDRIDFPSVYF